MTPSFVPRLLMGLVCAFVGVLAFLWLLRGLDHVRSRAAPSPPAPIPIDSEALKLRQYIDRLEFQAVQIIISLRTFQLVLATSPGNDVHDAALSVAECTASFKTLHRQHVQALRDGNAALAHDIHGRIQRLLDDQRHLIGMLPNAPPTLPEFFYDQRPLTASPPPIGLSDAPPAAELR